MTAHSTADGLPPATRIGRTALRVTDLEALTGFYRDVVGLAVLERTDARASLGAGDAPLLVLEAAEGAPDRHSTAAGLFHNAFRVPSRAALGDALGRLHDEWHLGGASDHGVSEALYTTDPEGNGIEIYRDFPRAEWPEAPDGSLRMVTEPLDLDPLLAAATGDAGVPPGTDVGHVHLEVSSLEAFRSFYVDLVGFDLQATVPAAVFVAAGGYHHHVGANTWNHRSGPVQGRGLAWFEVRLPDAAALAAVRERVDDGPYPIDRLAEGFAVTGPDEIEVRFRAEA